MALDLEAIGRVVGALGLRTQLCLISGQRLEWARWLIVPAPGYVEVDSAGPFRVAEVGALRIDPCERRRRGRLLAPQMVNRLDELEREFLSLGVDVVLDDEGYVCVALEAAPS